MKIGVLTSGGDSPGMNAVIRAVVRQGIAGGHETIGFFDGFEGLIENQYIPLLSADVGGIIDRGGTILRTRRCKRFYEEANQARAAKQLADERVEGLVIIGGDGTFRGGEALHRLGVRVVGVPASIDNDLYGTDYSIGFDTALNTVIENLTKIRDTASALERVFIVEVMGRKSGAIALHAGVAGGADYIILPDRPIEIAEICESVGEGFERGKSHYLVVLAEGAGAAVDVGKEIRGCGGYDVKIMVLGHIQRGGSPSAQDRLTASILGARAVEIIAMGESGLMVGIVANQVKTVPFSDAFGRKRELNMNLYELAKVLAI